MGVCASLAACLWYFLYACSYFEANKYDDDDDAEPCSTRYVSVATLNVIRYGRPPCRVKDCSLNWPAASRPSYTARRLLVTRVSVTTWLAAAKLGRLVLSQFVRCEHSHANKPLCWSLFMLLCDDVLTRGGSRQPSEIAQQVNVMLLYFIMYARSFWIMFKLNFLNVVRTSNVK